MYNVQITMYSVHCTMYSVHCTVNWQWPVEYKGLFSRIFFRPSFANFFIKVTFKIFFLIVEIYDFLLFLTFIFYSYFKLPNKTSSKAFSLKFFIVNPWKNIYRFILRITKLQWIFNMFEILQNLFDKFLVIVD